MDMQGVNDDGNGHVVLTPSPRHQSKTEAKKQRKLKARKSRNEKKTQWIERRMQEKKVDSLADVFGGLGLFKKEDEERRAHSAKSDHALRIQANREYTRELVRISQTCAAERRGLTYEQYKAQKEAVKNGKLQRNPKKNMRQHPRPKKNVTLQRKPKTSMTTRSQTLAMENETTEKITEEIQEELQGLRDEAIAVEGNDGANEIIGAMGGIKLEGTDSSAVYPHPTNTLAFPESISSISQNQHAGENGQSENRVGGGAMKMDMEIEL
ncbi:hypothetical protein P280DRAFT_513709 [Massarina eburnea CBS 473.64]|uniref:Uncharacterized protein n=1 Tax=Massarina eburnea CBS 473.64 TaxID=1395130 RepID=A0A6A6SFH4_9PLEO|nr:hypothetical protein P280DRAFT_513709 [Massarina eburnea CBS 473.64]